MKKMRVTRAAPRIQSQPLPAVKPQTVTTSPPTSITKGAQQQSSMFCLPHQVIDERTFKKQQRLIRNRESANLSRRKKKEFVDSLQETIQELGLEKEQLLSVRGEGIERDMRKFKILIFFTGEQSTQNAIAEQRVQSVQREDCGKGNGNRNLRQIINVEAAPEWICDKEELRSGLGHVVDGFAEFRTIKVSKQDALIDSENKGEQRVNGSINFVSPLYSNMLTSPPGSMAVDRSFSPSSSGEEIPTVRRHILWAADEQSPRNNSNAAKINSRNRRELREVDPQFPDLNATYPKCAQDAAEEHFINQTENIRIASELRRWIGEPEYLNLTRSGAVPSFVAPWQQQEPGKELEYDGNFLVNLMPKKYLRNRKLQQLKVAKKGKTGKRTIVKGNSQVIPSAMEVDIFKAPSKVEIKYAELFEELRRRDDTFYVVSFTADHLMLPALSINKTFRPKMSLMFPAVGFNESLNDSFVTMMQIDCEVLDTTLIQVRERLIPDHLRRLRNDTKPARQGEEVVENRPEFGPQRQIKRNNVTDGERFAGKPYFLESTRFDNRTAEGVAREGFE